MHLGFYNYPARKVVLMSNEPKFAPRKTAKLLLEDGTLIEGTSFGADKTVLAEIVFNTGMTGYQEILTDPSYAGQIVIMTYPLIGNYGINDDDVESANVQVSGLIVKEFCITESNWKSLNNISDYLKNYSILGFADVDTRMLTKKIRTKGTMNCLLTSDEITPELRQKLISYVFPKDIVSKVSTKTTKTIPGNGKKLALIDFGVKNGIVKHFSALDCEITIFPWDVSADEILSSPFDAVILSNGPGDPKEVKPAIELTKQLIGKMPIFGICLGHQILALALGADTYKLKFGHRGSNHPVMNLNNGKVYITAQNHGYAVSNINLPDSMKTTYVNVNDETIEGFSCPELNIHAVQFHPEAGPGPNDVNFIFNEWIDSLYQL